MSVWYYLVDDRGHTDGEWNYTSNVHAMVNAALADAGIELPPSTRPCWALPKTPEGLTYYPDGHGTIAWWEHLNGMTGAEGGILLDTIIREMEADPDRFKAMNPPNGWGDYDTFLKMLTDMRNSVPEWPTTWRASG